MWWGFETALLTRINHVVTTEIFNLRLKLDRIQQGGSLTTPTSTVYRRKPIMKVSRLSSPLREGVRCTFFPRSATFSPSLRRRVFDAQTRQITTTSKLQAGIAAPPVNFRNRDNTRNRDEFQKVADESEGVFYARLVPTSPSYFTAQPAFTDDLLHLTDLVNKYSGLPVVKPGDAPKVAWRSLMEYRNMVGESVKASRYSKILAVLQRLNQIHPALSPFEVKQTLKEFKRDIDPFQNKGKTYTLDQYGRALGSGRRKSSTARAWLVEGTGEVLVNGKSLAEAFGRIHDRESAIWALKATDRVDKYNVWALVTGGGTTGQAEALTLAVGKALLVHEPALKPALRRGKLRSSIYFVRLITSSTAGCVTRDPRRVERKKPGHVKARKMPTWVKR